MSTAIILDEGTELPASVGTQFTAADGITRITAYSIVNTTTSVISYTIHLVPSGDSPTDANKIAHQVEVNAGADVQVAAAIGQILNSSDTIQAFASSAGSLTQRVSGLQL